MSSTWSNSIHLWFNLLLGFLGFRVRQVKPGYKCRQQYSIKIHSTDNTVMGSFRNASCFLWLVLAGAPVRRSVHRMGCIFSSGFSPSVNQRCTTVNLFFFLIYFLCGCLTFDFVLGPFSFPTPTSILPGKYFCYLLPSQLATLLM